MKTRILKNSDILKCPFFIMVPEHYADDGACRCSDPTHKEMEKWGYRWNGKIWKGLNEYQEETNA